MWWSSATHSRDVWGTQFFDTEILQLDLTAGGLLLRESPTLHSTGQTTVRSHLSLIGGLFDLDYMISRFSDVFTEISMDGGTSWIPTQQSGHLELRIDPAAVAPVIEPTPLLPPPNGVYVSPQLTDWELFPYVILNTTRWKFFTGSVIPPVAATTITNSFNLTADMQFTTNGGSSFQNVRVSAPAQMTVASHGSSSDTIYDIEIIGLNFTLPGGLMIRESPTEPSRGEIEVDPLPDGTYRISSSLWVFTELSLDGGASWQPPAVPIGDGHGSFTEPFSLFLVTPAPETAEPTHNLPPLIGVYADGGQWFALYANGIIITNASNDHFTQDQPPPPPGGSQTENFGSRMTGLISMDGGATFTPFSAPANSSVQVNSYRIGSWTRVARVSLTPRCCRSTRPAGRCPGA